jgi:hypothetical protein
MYAMSTADSCPSWGEAGDQNGAAIKLELTGEEAARPTRHLCRWPEESSCNCAKWYRSVNLECD